MKLEFRRIGKEEGLIKSVGCTGMTHSAAMALEILPGKTILEALNTDLVCDVINVAMRELFLQISYGRSRSAFSKETRCVAFLAGHESLAADEGAIGITRSANRVRKEPLQVII